ncbi:hypothetical protein [Aestuariivita boseongensis]|uniref:hypothetical protein n=1 Tax=Aestuariivita boseongensis TaxID=1470562 RepID=UPI0006818DB2|nr:hypothetical protein [Aestuariivita boseongensis]
MMISGAAQAFELENAEVSFNYQNGNVDNGFDGHGFDVFANARYRFSDQFSLDFGIGYADADSDAPATDFSATSLSVVGRYHFSETFDVGVFLDYSDIDTSPGVDNDAFHYGLTLSFNADGFFGDAYIGEGDYDTFTSKSDVYGLSAGVQLDTGLSLGAFYGREDINTWEAKEYGIFMGYVIERPGSIPPVSINASLSRINLDPGLVEVDVFRLGVTFPLGGTQVDPGLKTSHPRSTLLRLGTSIGRF